MKNRGFTILETIIAVLVLSLAISGVFSAVQQGLSQAIIAKDEVRAFYLAQEAIEIIRNKRDVNQLNITINGSPNSWLFGIAQEATDNCYFGKICRADVSNMSLAYCGNAWGSCENLRQHPTEFRYGYDSGWPVTNFKREIQIESVNANEITVTVRVSWTKGLISQEFKAKTHLFNWI